MKYLVVLLGLMASVAQAGEASLRWTQPTQNTDGSTIPATGTGSLVGNRVEWGTCSGTNVFGTRVGEQVLTSPVAAYVVTNLAAGTYCFRVFASTTYGESAASPVVSKTVLAPVPMPPAGLTVVAQTAYTVVKRTDRFVMLPVGTVATGTLCDVTQSVNGYYVVPRSAVTWAGNVRPDVVVASCQ